MILPRLAAIAASIALPLVVRAETSPVRVRVEQKSDLDSSKYSTKQTKSLKVFLSNSAKEDLAGLKVKYFYFVREVKSRDIKVLQKGEQTAELKGLGNAVVETPAATAKSTDKHTEGGNFNTTKKNAKVNYGKTVEASGEKFVGFGVQVLGAGGKVLAESFEPQSLKQEVGAK